MWNGLQVVAVFDIFINREGNRIHEMLSCSELQEMKMLVIQELRCINFKWMCDFSNVLQLVLANQFAIAHKQYTLDNLMWLSTAVGYSIGQKHLGQT